MLEPTNEKNEFGTIIEKSNIGQDGEIDRIDFIFLPDHTVMVKKISAYGTGMKEPGTQATTILRYAEGFNFDDALSVLEKRGWEIRRYIWKYNGENYQPGARAWKNGATPIRNRDEIKRMRERLIQESGIAIRQGREIYGGRVVSSQAGFDLAYEL